MEAIRTENLTKYYGRRIRAVHKLNLVVEEGKAVGLLGPNGAGKTTTMKILTGLLKPTSGKAFIYDVDVTKNPVKALRNVGAMIENPELYPELTARENLQYIGRLKGLSGSLLERRVNEVLEIVRMSEWADELVGRFSRGMKQRIAIAQAMVSDPEILILDEPSLGLDPRGMAEIREVIKETNKQGATILLASHLLSEVQQICDEVILINKGEVVLSGNINELQADSGIRIYDVVVVEKVDESLLRRLESFDFVEKTEVVNSNTFKLYLEVPESEVADFLKELVEMGFRVIEFKRSGSFLEDMYMRIVKEVS